jgi:hypothetical protein
MVWCRGGPAGPVSGQDVDRWEENPGASPFTIGLEIVALLVAATRLTGPEQALALALADNWNERLEEFTYVSGDEVDQAFGTEGHYVRIGLSGSGRVALANQPQGTQPVDAAALVGLEFGYLPRLGLRAPADKRVTDTLAIVEAMLAADTPSGRAYHRYDIDGYGEWLDGSGWPVRKFGIGRPWPLLAGERGHLDVLSGGDASAQLRAMLAMRGRGGLLPEQVWDAGQLPWQNLRPGQPTGSAMPLAWAHSELIKLAVAVATKKPVELLALVSNRYQAAVPASQTWFWRDWTPVVALPAGRTLVVAGPGPFTLHYGFNDWDPATITERDAQALGLGLFGVTLTPADLGAQASLQFVRRYPDGSWEPATRHDVTLGVPGPATLRLSDAHLGRLAAAGARAREQRLGDARRRGPLDRVPPGVRLTLGSLGLAAAAQAEQALGVQQVDGDGQVDDQRHHLQRGDALEQLVYLVRHEDDGRHERQVLRPPLGEPEPDRLDALQHRISGDRGADQVQVPDADGEQVLQVVHDAVVAGGDRTAQAALQVLEDAGEFLVQRGPVTGEQQDGGGQRAQDQEVQQAVQGD